MAIRVYKPTSPGRRNSSVNTYSELTKGAVVEKRLLAPIRRQAGRNFQGKITVRHRGGGNKRFYRLVDFAQQRYDLPATVQSIQYDPNRTAFIALVKYTDGVPAYILAPSGLTVGQTVIWSRGKVEIKTGNRTQLQFIPTGIQIHNLELFPGQGGQIVRSAGTSATIMSLEGEYAQVKLPSGEIRKFLKAAAASIGQISNVEHANIRWGKAGRMRWFGIRPSVRGKAMNPVDHPHGGGEGHNPIGLKYPKTPQGKHALGVKTRKRKKQSNRLIVSRRPKT